MTLTHTLLATSGGVLIGLSGVLLMATRGRIAGISGIVAHAHRPEGGWWRGRFVAGLLLGGLLMVTMTPSVFENQVPRALPTLIFAGLLVGFGTRLGSGCTSGHGVCGLARFSPRSAVATALFTATGVATVIFARAMEVSL